MFGAWQVGAWRALAPAIHIDMVVGASVGALNGWAIAGGASPDELAQAWLDRESADLIRPCFPSPWLFDAAPLHRMAQALVERYRPVIRFATTLTEVPGLRVHMVRGEKMTWHHLAASCTIPGGFPPQQLDGKWFVDGGLMGALPVWAAAAMGADRVIALDALPLLPSRVLRSGVGMLRRVRNAPATPPCTLVRLVPLRPLGRLRDAIYWKRDNAARWMEQGQHDARHTLAR